MTTIRTAIASATVACLLAASGAAHAGGALAASSHSDAPLIKQDPQANLTDVYAFLGRRYDDPSQTVLNVIANVRPFSEPGDGPHYDRFASDARYSLHITSPSTGETLIRYDFEFSAVDAGLVNPGTILSYGLGTEPGPIMTIGDARQNFSQTYTVTRVEGASAGAIIEDALVGLPNPGSRVTPLYNDDAGKAVSGAVSLDDLDAYTRQAIFDAGGGAAVFAGPRDDSFYADIPGTFDLLNPRILDNNGDLSDGLGQDGGGTDGFRGFNVLTFGIQIPVDDLPASTYSDAFFGEQTGVGVFASVSRQQTLTRISGDEFELSGPFVQINRLGNPLFNEALVPLSDKDRFNATDPVDDAQFAIFAENPELADLINLVFGTAFESSNRQDLVAVFIPDVLRVATTTGPVPLAGEPGFSRFGFIGDDVTGGISSGWPNGRRFGDDVIDIALTAIASGPDYAEITIVGDNVEANDIAFNRVFPYAATPHAGANNSKDRPLTEFEIADQDDDGEITIFDVLAFLNIWERVGGF
ncbi:MAG: DUF4331 domain-containing protein [Planctomycetota bacterium]